MNSNEENENSEKERTKEWRGKKNATANKKKRQRKERREKKKKILIIHKKSTSTWVLFFPLDDNSVSQQRVIYHPMKFNPMSIIRNLPNQHQWIEHVMVEHDVSLLSNWKLRQEMAIH